MWWDSKVEDYRGEVREFAETVVAPVADAMDANSEFNADLLAAMKKHNLVSLL